MNFILICAAEMVSKIGRPFNATENSGLQRLVARLVNALPEKERRVVNRLEVTEHIDVKIKQYIAKLSKLHEN